MTVKIGVTLPQFTDDPQRFKDAVALVQDSGLDSMWLFDHLWPLSGSKERPILESWSTLAWLAAVTRNVEIGTLVTRSTMRHPAVLAKMMATAGSIAPGRLVVAVGSGDELSRGENEAFGLPYFEADDRIDQFRSCVELLVRFQTQDEVTQHDDFLDIEALPASPRPSMSPRVWVGGRSGDALEIAGLLADGWNGWGSTPERFAQDATTVLDHAAGRPIELSWGGLVDISDDPSPDGDGDVVVGTAAQVTERLAAFADTGASHLVLTPSGRWDSEIIEKIATEVAPALRSA